MTSLALVLTLLPANAHAQESMSLDIEKAIQLASAHHRKTKMREDEVEAAGYRRKQAMGRFLPKLSMSARYSRVNHVEPGALLLPAPTLTDANATNTVRLGEAVDNQYSLRLSVEQPLFSGFALSSGYQATKHAEQVAHQRVRAERMSVRAVTHEVYFGLLKAREIRDVTEGSVKTLEEHLQRMKLLYESGRATDLDVSRVQSRVASARVSLVQVRGAVDDAQLALATLLGLPSTTVLELLDPMDDNTPMTIPGAAELVPVALESRPEIRIARENAAIAAKRVDVEGSALWPQLALRFGYNYDRPNQRYFPAHDRFDGSWDASAILSWTAWDWGVTYYGMKAAQAEASAAVRNVDDTRDAVRLDVERQRQGYINTKARITAARESLRSSERAYNAATILFDAGRAESLDVLDAATELTRARSDFVQALADTRIAWAHVQKAVGRD